MPNKLDHNKRALPGGRESGHGPSVKEGHGDSRNSPAISLSTLETLAEMGRAEELVGRIHLVIANKPVTQFLDAIEGKDLSVSPVKAEQMYAKISAVLVPHCMQSLKAYVEDAEPEVKGAVDNIFSSFTDREKFYLSLLFAYDRGTANHCMDVMALGFRAMNTLPHFKKTMIPGEQRAAFLKACVFHDCGKMCIPNVVLNSPLKGPEMGEIYSKAHNGEQMPAGDPRAQVATHDVAKGQEDILADYEIPAQESFADTLARHEHLSGVMFLRANENTLRGGLKVVPHYEETAAALGRVVNMILSHHNYSSTQRARQGDELTKHFPPRPEDEKFCELLKIVDICRALRPHAGPRVYQDGVMPWNNVKRILLQEADRGKIDPELTRELVDAFVDPEIAKEEKDIAGSPLLLSGPEQRVRAFDLLREQSGAIAEQRLAAMESIPVQLAGGSIPLEFSSAIGVITNALLRATFDDRYVRAVRIYLEKNLAIVPLLFSKAVHNQPREFSVLLKQIEDEVQRENGAAGAKKTAKPSGPLEASL